MSISGPGFAAPVTDSQSCFRAVLDAMARPGRIHTLTAPPPPPGLDPATAAVILTLADAETSIWFDEGAASARDWVAFHCGAPNADAASATFALAVAPVDLDDFNAGTDDAPELGATVILQVAALGQGRAYTLSGPGIEGRATLMTEGLPDGFAANWAANCRRCPRGVDVILCAGNRVAALPRTVVIEDR